MRHFETIPAKRTRTKTGLLVTSGGLLAAIPLSKILERMQLLGLSRYAKELNVPAENLKAHIEARIRLERGPR